MIFQVMRPDSHRVKPGRMPGIDGARFYSEIRSPGRVGVPRDDELVPLHVGNNFGRNEHGFVRRFARAFREAGEVFKADELPSMMRRAGGQRFEWKNQQDSQPTSVSQCHIGRRHHQGTGAACSSARVQVSAINPASAPPQMMFVAVARSLFCGTKAITAPSANPPMQPPRCAVMSLAGLSPRSVNSMTPLITPTKM